jgi:hypothetical protein
LARQPKLFFENKQFHLHRLGEEASLSGGFRALLIRHGVTVKISSDFQLA